MISVIVAIGENRVIGKNNQLPWHLPADLKRFKELTTGHAILMGRKTYESIGRALPNRSNIIISRNPQLMANGCIVVSSLQEAIQKAISEKNGEIFIIGGSEIYRQSLPYADRLYLTIVHHHFEGDAFFPELDESKWQEIERTDLPADALHAYAYSFLTLEHIR
ncbi:MAG: dihydrofolate reductase [Gammaproteobacteria bacterium]|nr:dihydrofolate reductase [Gammaproteobacteria bacterium]